MAKKKVVCAVCKKNPASSKASACSACLMAAGWRLASYGLLLRGNQLTVSY
jgi:hypothetical protein